MTDSNLAELARENRDLRQVVKQLSAIVLRNAAEQRQLAMRQADAVMTPVERIAKLRELSVQSGQWRTISLRLMQIGSHVAMPKRPTRSRGLPARSPTRPGTSTPSWRPRAGTSSAFAAALRGLLVAPIEIVALFPHGFVLPFCQTATGICPWCRSGHERSTVPSATIESIAFSRFVLTNRPA